MVFYMGLGPEPFQWVNQELRFEPKPILAKWLFAPTARNGFDKNTFAFKVFGKTWVIYRQASRQDTFGGKGLRPAGYRLHYEDGETVVHEGKYLPDRLARDLREGKLSRLAVELE